MVPLDKQIKTQDSEGKIVGSGNQTRDHLTSPIGANHEPTDSQDQAIGSDSAFTALLNRGKKVERIFYEA